MGLADFALIYDYLDTSAVRHILHLLVELAEQVEMVGDIPSYNVLGCIVASEEWKLTEAIALALPMLVSYR